MRSGTARLLLAACSTLTLVACGSVAGPPAGTGPPATRTQAGGHGTAAHGTPAHATPTPQHLRSAAAAIRVGGRRDRDRADALEDTAGDQ